MTTPTPATSELWAHVRETVLLVDASGTIASASPSWAAYGHESDDLVDRPLTTVIHPDDRTAFEAFLLRPESARDAPSIPTRMLCGDGSWIEAVAELRLVADASSERLSVSFLPLDELTARTLTRERRAADQLRLIDETKHLLLEVVSHELRTPLTVIAGFGQTLQRPDANFPTDQLNRIGASIDRHAARLHGLVRDLVDLDRTTRGALLEDLEATDLAAIVHEVVAAVPLGSRELHLHLEPVSAPVDPQRFARIVECLLDNVRRHTPPDATAWVRLARTDGDALLEVSDDGPGLPTELREEVFVPFAQGRLRDAATPGLGLGLALVRRFAELHGGRCWHSDREGGGARFCVSLPGSPLVHPDEELDAEWRSVGMRGSVDPPRAADDVELAPEARDAVAVMLRSVRQELGMRVAYLSVFSATDQVVVATDGDGESLGIRVGTRVPLGDTYCMRMVRGRVGNLVVDTSREPELAVLPATDAGIACYAGVPVHLPNGHVVGSLCCAHERPLQALDEGRLGVMRAVAQLAGDLLERQQLIASDRRNVTERVTEVLRRRDGLQIVFQPIVELATGRVAGVEALARFPDRKLRSPDLWFAEAARVGLAAELEQTAVLRALRGLDQLPAEMYVSLNLSPEVIVAGGLRPLLGRVALDRIVIEITEHAAIDDYTHMETLLRPFRDGGARLAIDDVGAGFASLRHVLRLAPDVIKVDRSLVAQITTDAAQHAVTHAFAGLADRLGAKVVAEGIEDAETLAALADAGITHGQGWFFDRPGPLPLPRVRYAT